MGLEALKAAVHRWVIGDRLSVDLAANEIDALLPLLRILPENRLDLSQVEIRDVHDLTPGLILTGVAVNSWRIPGLAAALDTLRLTLTMTHDPESGEMIVRGQFSAQLRALDQTFTVTAVAGATGWSLSLQSSAATNLQAVAALVPTGQLLGRLPARLLGQLADGILSSWELRFDPACQMKTDLTYTVAFPVEWAMVPEVLVLREVRLGAQITFDPRAPRVVATAETGFIGGTVQVAGTSYQVTTHVGNAHQMLTTIEAGADGRPFTLSDMAVLIGMGDDADRLDQFCAQFGFRGLQLTRFTMVIDAVAQRIASTMVAGRLFLGDLAMEMGLSYPDLTLTARLADGSQIDVKDLIRHFGGEVGSLPALAVTQFDLQVLVRSRRVVLEAAVSSDLSIQAGDVTLTLTEVDLELQCGPAGVEARLTGWTKLNDARCFASIEVPSMAVSMGLDAMSELNLKALGEALLPGQMTLPADLPEVVITEFYAEASPRDGALALQGTAAVRGDQWSLPLGRTSLALRQLELDLARQREGERMALQVALAGEAEFASARLRVSVALPSLAASVGLAPGSSLSLKHLVNALVDESLQIPAEWPEVVLRDLNLAVSRREGGTDLDLKGNATTADGKGIGLQIGQLDLALTEFGVALARSNGETRFNSVGKATIGGAAFRVDLALPALAIDAGLEPGSSLNLTQLVEALLPGELSVPADLPEIILYDLRLQANHAERSFRLHARATAKAPGLTATINRLEIGVTELELEIERSAARTFARLYTEIQVDGAPFGFEFKLPGPDLVAGLAPGAQFNLSRTVAKLLPAELVIPEGLPEVTFHELQVALQPSKGSFAISAASQDTWPIQIGEGISVGQLHLKAAAERNASGSLVPSGEFGGTLSLGGTDLKALVRLGARDLVLYTQVDRIKLFGLLESVLGMEFLRQVPVPQQIWDLELTDVSTALSPLTPSFMVQATAPGFERLFVLAEGGKSSAKLVAGLVAAPRLSFGALGEALAPLDQLTDGFTFKRTYLILSSSNANDLPAEIAKHVAAGGSAPEINRGLNFSMGLDLSQSGIREILPLDEIALSGYFDPISTRAMLKGGLQGEFGLGTDVAKLKEAVFFLRLQGSRVGLGLLTKVGVQMGDDYLTFSGELAVSSQDVGGAVTMEGTWDDPLGAQGLAIGDLALELGFTYASRTPKIGIAGTTQIGNLRTKAAVKFDAGDPTRCVLQMAVKDLKLSDVLSTFCQGSVLQEIPAEIKRTIDTAAINEAEIYVAPMDTQIGELQYEQGLRLVGDVTIWDLDAHGKAALSFDEGLKLDARISRDIEIGDAFKLTGVDPGQTPHLYVEIPMPGKLPVIDIEGNLSMAGVTNQKTKVKLRDTGFYFEQETKLFDLLMARLKVEGGLHNGSAGIKVRGEFKDDLTQMVQQHASAVLHAAANQAKSSLDGAKAGLSAAQRKVDELNGQLRNLQAETHAKFDTMKADVVAKRRELEAKRAEVALLDSALEAARRAAEADKQRTIAHLQAKKAELDRAQAEVNRIQTEIANTQHWFDNLQWWEKPWHAVPTGLKIAALWAAHGVATLALQAARGIVDAAQRVVNAFNIEFDPRVLAVKGSQALAYEGLKALDGILQLAIAGLNGAQRAFDEAFNGLSSLLAAAVQALERAKEGLDLVKRGLEIGEEFLEQVIQAAGQVLSIREAVFDASLDVLKGGHIMIAMRLIYLGKEHRINWQFNFGSPIDCIKTIAEYLLGRGPSAVSAAA